MKTIKQFTILLLILSITFINSNKDKIHKEALDIFLNLTPEQMLKMNPLKFKGLVENDGRFNPEEFIKEKQRADESLQDMYFPNTEEDIEFRKNYPHLFNEKKESKFLNEIRDKIKPMNDEEFEEFKIYVENNLRKNQLLLDHLKRTDKTLIHEGKEHVVKMIADKINNDHSDCEDPSHCEHHRRRLDESFSSLSDISFWGDSIVNHPPGTPLPSHHINEEELYIRDLNKTYNFDNNPMWDWKDPKNVIVWIYILSESLVKVNKIVDTDKPWGIVKNVTSNENKNNKLWYQQCHDYRNQEGSYIYHFSNFKTRKCDYVQETPSFERCSCDIGEVFNGIFCCKDEYQCINQTGRRWGYCYPSKTLIAKQGLARIENIDKDKSNESGISISPVTKANDSEIFANNSWTNSD